MIELKDVVRIARDSLLELFEQADVRDLTIEDVELSKDQQTWVVIFSSDRHLDGMDGFAGVQRRVYRHLRIQAEDGRVLSMRQSDHRGDEQR